MVLTNYHGADIYAIAKALYNVVSDFNCGNEKNDKVTICFHGKNLCLPCITASWFIACGATWGACDKKCSVPLAREDAALNSKLQIASNEPEAPGVFPNPFTTSVTFSFKSQKAGQAIIRLYDMNGKIVATVFNGYIQKGIVQKTNFDGSRLPAGIYLSRLQTASGTSEQRVVKIH